MSSWMVDGRFNMTVHKREDPEEAIREALIRLLVSVCRDDEPLEPPDGATIVAEEIIE